MKMCPSKWPEILVLNDYNGICINHFDADSIKKIFLKLSSNRMQFLIFFAIKKALLSKETLKEKNVFNKILKEKDEALNLALFSSSVTSEIEKKF